jgi:hypothetical protein
MRVSGVWIRFYQVPSEAAISENVDEISPCSNGI